jgi:hypothetical protein
MIGQGAAIFGCEGMVLGAAERDFFRDYDPFGFIIFARNVDTVEQLQRLTADLRDAVGRDAPILIDQEGGRVQRLRAPQWREWAPPLDTVQRAGVKSPRARPAFVVGAGPSLDEIQSMLSPHGSPTIDRQLLATKDAQARARTDVARAAVSAFRALGGGWSSKSVLVSENADVRND